MNECFSVEPYRDNISQFKEDGGQTIWTGKGDVNALKLESTVPKEKEIREQVN